MKPPHIFLDTNIFIGQNYQYDSTMFARIISLAQSKKIFVFITTITIQEVESHIRQEVEEAHKRFEDFRAKNYVRILKNVNEPPIYGIFDGFAIERTKEVLLTQFRQFLADVRVQVVDVSDVSIDDIFEKYFSRTSPFGEDKKKHEFPDAFALAALEQWCNNFTGERMYVISSDPDMVSACEQSRILRSVESLPEFLDLLTRGEELADFVSKLLKDHRTEVEHHIEEAASSLNLFYEPYGQVQYTYIDSVEVLKQYLIEVDEGKAVFDVIATVNYSASVLYNSLAIGMMGTREEVEHNDTNIQAEVSISFNKESQNKFKIENVFIKNSDVIIYPFEAEDEFGIKHSNAQKSLNTNAKLIIELLGGIDWVIENSPEAIRKQFNLIKESLPVRVILDLRTLQYMNSYNGGLDYQGAMTIKSKAKGLKFKDDN